MSKDYPILYSFRRCPWAMRARMALAYAGQICALREVDLKDKPSALLEVSPKGTVPVLVLTDGTVIAESFDIMLWAIAQNDPDAWGSGIDHALIGPPLKPLLDAIKVFKYDEDNAGWHSAVDICMTWLMVLNVILDNKGFLTGDQCALVDIALFPIIRQLSRIDVTWFENLACTSVYQWLDAIAQTTYFKQAMEKYPVWQPGDMPVLFPKPSVM